MSPTHENSGTIRCGAFLAIRIGAFDWRFTCDWLPEFDKVVSCSQDTAARMVIQLQAENRQPVAA